MRLSPIHAVSPSLRNMFRNVFRTSDSVWDINTSTTSQPEVRVARLEGFQHVHRTDPPIFPLPLANDTVSMRLLSFCFTYRLQKHPQDDVLGVGSARPWVHCAGFCGFSAGIPACSCFSEFHGVVKVGQYGQSLLILQVPWTLSMMFWGPRFPETNGQARTYQLIMRV